MNKPVTSAMDDEEPKHEKITEYTKNEDGSITIESKSYFESLSNHLKEHEKQLWTSYYTLKADVDETLKHMLDDGSPKLVLTIEAKKPGIRITKRWVEFNKKFPRR